GAYTGTRSSTDRASDYGLSQVEPCATSVFLGRGRTCSGESYALSSILVAGIWPHVMTTWRPFNGYPLQQRIRGSVRTPRPGGSPCGRPPPAPAPPTDLRSPPWRLAPGRRAPARRCPS